MRYGCDTAQSRSDGSSACTTALVCPLRGVPRLRNRAANPPGAPSSFVLIVLTSMWAALLLVASQAAAAPVNTLVPTACNGESVVVDGVGYKTKVYLVQDGFPPTPIVTNNSKVKLTVKATLAATHAPFPFELPQLSEFVLPPSRANGMIIGFDVGLGAVSRGRGMTKDSTRVLCIPPEEGYGAMPLPGIPANSTLLIEIKCVADHLPAL